MLEERNVLTHTYDEEKAKLAVHQICNLYLAAIDKIHEFFMKKLIFV